MSNDFTVGVSYDPVTNEYGITCRRLASSKHWKYREGNPSTIYDSRDPSPKMFSVLFVGPEKEAKLFAETLKMSYTYQGVTKVTVKSDSDE
jgi:hypothetical protein